MSRAGLSGFLIGGVVAVAGVGTLSLIADPPQEPLFTTDVPGGADAPRDSASNAPTNGTQSAQSSVQAGAVRVTAPDADDAPLDVATAEPGNPKPHADTKGSVVQAATPKPVEQDVLVGSVEPVLPSPQAVLPGVPDEDAVAAIKTRPADPTAPETSATKVQDTLSARAVLDDAPQPDDADLEFEVSQSFGTEWLEPTPRLTAPDVADAPDVLTEAAQPADAATQTEETVVAQAQTEVPVRPTIGKPARSLITDRTATPEAEPAAVVTDAPADEAALGALEKYKQVFDDADDRPKLSIVLMDTGQNLDNGPVGLKALGSFPYALSFAVDAELPDAADRAAMYRSQGFEVLALVDLPESLTASDTEVAMTAALDAVPEAIGVLEGAESGLQGNKDMSDQVTDILLATGHGMLWRPNGLDTAQKLAAREGVRTRTIFRDFDSKDQTPTVIRRFLDQAAFKAGQEDGVVMVGRVRPDTISALLLWGLQDRAQRVAVSPASAILIGSAE